MFLTLMLLAGSALAGVAPGDDGVIEGTVIRAADQSAVPGAEVVLRIKLRDELISLAETVADAQGHFRFEGLATRGAILYLPGANHQGIHYPGSSLRLSSSHRRAEVKLAVCDAVAFPNPLVVRSHTITFRPEDGALRVTESMLIDNPSATCYVGQAVGQLAEPVTLQITIPADFERVTFTNEFFGRRFSLVGGKLVTGVPWQPGQRELSFSYVLPRTQGHYVWQRPLDLPTAQVRISAHADQPSQVTCNLNRALRHEEGEAAFDTGGRPLEAGFSLHVELGRLPISLMTYAPGGALAALGSLMLVTLIVLFKK
jgi:hypothetical protein